MNPQLASDVLHDARMIECEPTIDRMVVWYGGPSHMNVFKLSTFEFLNNWPVSTLTAEEASIAARAYLDESS